MKTLVTLFALVVCSPVAAQQLPNPEPGEAHALLARDVGTWDCKVTMHFEGGPKEFTAVETNRLVNRGLHLVTTFEMPMGERTFTGHGLTGWDAKSKKYVGTWADSFTTTPARTEGTVDPETNTSTTHSTVVDPSGAELVQKQVTKWTGDDEKTFTIFLVIEVAGVKQDLKLMEMTARRRAGKAD
jgi:hypothetical protein